MPEGFPYREVFLRGKPQHERFDDFDAKHPKMPCGKRAKIFAPFDALKGFEERLDEKCRLYMEKRELNEEERGALDAALQYLHERTANLRVAKESALRATVTYYVPCMDENHEAYGCRGLYESFSGVVWKVDSQLRHSLLIGDREIELADISAITIEKEP